MTTNIQIDLATTPTPGRAETPPRWYRTLLRQPRAVVALAYLIVLILAGLFASTLSPFPQQQQKLLQESG